MNSGEGESREEMLFLLKCCFTSTETVRTIRDGSPGRPPRLSLSSWAVEKKCRAISLFNEDDSRSNNGAWTRVVGVKIRNEMQELRKSSNSNSITLFYKDFSIGSANLTSSPSLLSYWWIIIKSNLKGITHNYTYIKHKRISENLYMKRKRARIQSVGVKIRNVVQELREKDSEEERDRKKRERQK